MSVRVRFAPSPTGYLHVGGLRTALFNYLFAKKENGKLILRIEDTDQSRKVEDAVEKILISFNKMNIEFDEGPKNKGKYSPYFQSQRLEIYKKYVNILLENGIAYPCFCTPERLAKIKKQKQSLKQNTKYDRKCLSLTDKEIAKKYQTMKYVIRLKVPDNKEIKFNDLVRKNVSFKADEIDDQILLKSDGFPTYHLANVVDDHLMRITHVIRGEEWLSSTPKHILLYNALGWDIPQFVHIPLLLNSDKSKLSKRQGDVAVEDYLKKGILPEALINYIALLGWNPGDKQEFFSTEELISKFSLDRIHMAGAVFDQKKLSWMNSEYLKNLSLNKIVKYARDFVTYNINMNDKKFMNVIDFVRNRISYLSELNDEIKYFYFHNVKNHPDSTLLYEKSSQILFDFWLKELSADNKWNSEFLKNLINKTTNELGVKGKNFFFPIRLAIYGECKGPDIMTICNILGRDEIISRLHSVKKG